MGHGSIGPDSDMRLHATERVSSGNRLVSAKTWGAARLQRCINAISQWAAAFLPSPSAFHGKPFAGICEGDVRLVAVFGRVQNANRHD